MTFSTWRRSDARSATGPASRSRPLASVACIDPASRCPARESSAPRRAVLLSPDRFHPHLVSDPLTSRPFLDAPGLGRGNASIRSSRAGKVCLWIRNRRGRRRRRPASSSVTWASSSSVTNAHPCSSTRDPAERRWPRPVRGVFEQGLLDLFDGAGPSTDLPTRLGDRAGSPGPCADYRSHWFTTDGIPCCSSSLAMVFFWISSVPPAMRLPRAYL